MANVTIVGGGVIGLFSAYYLQKEGYGVRVIDNGFIRDGCSFGNMGYMSPSHFMPLASPGIIAEGLKYMTSSSSPFYIKPRLNMDLLKWAWKFYKSSNATTAAKNAPHLNNILQLSRQLMNDVRIEIGDTFMMEEKGCFNLCKSKKTLDHEFHVADEAEKFGLKVERLDRAGVQQLEPDVELDVAGAVLFKDDCHFHPGEMMEALENYLLEKGVQIETGATVTGFEKTANSVSAVITSEGKFECEHLVIATGSWLPVISKMLGIELLLQPGKGYSHTYRNVEKNIRYPAILVDGRCAITPWGKMLRIGGTMEFSGYNNDILDKRMLGIYNSVKSFYPGLDIGGFPHDEIWNGLRPVTPDGLAYISRTDKYDNVVFAGGHAMLGISQGTGTGLLVSQLIANKKTEIDLSAFRLNRF
jgi:D-amino-acid dehydrogenase